MIKIAATLAFIIIAFFAMRVSNAEIEKCQETTTWSKERCATEISR